MVEVVRCVQLVRIFDGNQPCVVRNHIHQGFGERGFARTGAAHHADVEFAVDGDLKKGV